MPDLRRYHQKRDPDTTPEPFGAERARRARAPDAPHGFVVQQHAATGHEHSGSELPKTQVASPQKKSRRRAEAPRGMPGHGGRPSHRWWTGENTTGGSPRRAIRRSRGGAILT